MTQSPQPTEQSPQPAHNSPQPTGQSPQPTHQPPASARQLEAVLLDMDGTLCDTEPAWMAAEWAIAKRYGADWSDEDALALVGFDLLDAGAYIKRRMGIDLSPAEIEDEMLAAVIAQIAESGVTWMPGALELVAACNEASVPTGLVTMSYRNLADAVVGAMPRGRFDTVVTGDEVTRGKPAPDPYLKAAAQLGTDAARCVAIEDSSTGSASAAAAGCAVLVVPNHVEVAIAGRMVRRTSLVELSLDDIHRLVASI